MKKLFKSESTESTYDFGMLLFASNLHSCADVTRKGYSEVNTFPNLCHKKCGLHLAIAEVLHNVFTLTRNAVDLGTHGSNKELTDK